MTTLSAADLQLNEFAAMVQATAWPVGSLLMAFSPAKCIFDEYRFNGEFLPATDQGRIFSPAGECCWRRVDGLMRVVYLGDSPPGGLVDKTALLDGLVPRLEEVFLWGVRTELEDEWLEQQVPHRFAYPAIAGTMPRGRVALVVESWEDSTGGMARFKRYHSITEKTGG